MTTFICFVIAMVFLYLTELFNGGFELSELLEYFIMVLVVGLHVYLSTREKAILGIVVPILIVASYYPVYRIINPIGTELIFLLVLYSMALVGCIYVWYKARKDHDN